MNCHDVQVTSTPADTPPDIREFFNRTTDYWDTLYEGRALIHRQMNDRKTTVLSEVQRLSRGHQLKILDLGCGTGILTQSLLEKGHYVAGLDCSENMLARLRQSVGGTFGKRFLGAIQAGVSHTPFQDGQFDLILCVGVIQYQHGENGVLKEISRLLKTGGHCILTLPNLLTVGHLTDPVYGLRFIQRLYRRLLFRTEPCAGTTGAFRIVGSLDGAEPYNKKYLKWEILPAIKKHGLELRKEIGYGFGPATFVGRALLPDKLSSRISDAITSMSKRPCMAWLLYFANRWVFVTQKV
jgi:SAM-dependent methyltransferase